MSEAEDKENTWRVLQDQTPILKTRCRLGFHRWTLWKFVCINKDSYERNGRLDDFTVSPVLYKSECTECGKKKYRSQKEPRVAYS